MNSPTVAPPEAASTALLARIEDVLRRSPQKESIVRLIVRGLREKQIAAELGISRHTVHGHIKDLYRDLGIHDRAVLVLLGREMLSGDVWHAQEGGPV